MGEQQKTKVAILGGGMAGLSAAFYLTSTEELRDTYEVTLYQMGWRLGGKCATGRGVFDRIEEHGIHAFVGSYFNALAMMSACYEEMANPPDGGAPQDGVLASFAHAFQPADSVVLWEWTNGQMMSWPFSVSRNRMKIGTAGEIKASLALAKELIRTAVAVGKAYYDDRVAGRPPPVHPLTVFRALAALFPTLAWIVRRWDVVGPFVAASGRAGLVKSGLVTFESWFRSGKILLTGAKIRRLRVLANYFLTVLRGIFNPEHNVFEEGGFDKLDVFNYIDWLRRNGLTADSEKAPIAINTVDISYNFPDGDNSRQPEMGAGTYLRWGLRSMLNLQSWVWSFEAGTGETVIAPLYHVLKRRGVKFAFFHKVKALMPSADGHRIASVEFDVQADPKAAEYDPLVLVDIDGSKQGGHDLTRPGGFLYCWPGKPKYKLLKDGDALKKQGGDLESYWTAPKPVRPRTLRSRENAEDGKYDYDKIVFAIAIGAVPHLFPEMDIMGASPVDERTAKWRAMVEGVPACATQTLQVWFQKTSKRMGAAALNRGQSARYRAISGTFVAPFNGQADFSRLIGYEGWNRDRWRSLATGEPRAVWYFSGALTLRFPKPGDPPVPTESEASVPSHVSGARATAPPFTERGFPKQQDARVWDFAVQFLQATAGYLLSKAYSPWQPLGLRFDWITKLGDAPHDTAQSERDERRNLIEKYDLTESAEGTLALHNQFWKANIEPTERYTQCPPRPKPVRLAADGSGFANLYLAGDWIANHLNIGSVEGAVMGGKLAARAICGSPALDDIVGYGVPAPPGTAHPEPRPQPTAAAKERSPVPALQIRTSRKGLA
jgi:uncharacterized protein with NAD-binding domain and iron-sulfur cluster